MAPLLKYSVLRLGLFLVALVTIWKLGADPVLAVLLAAVVSMLLSYVLLRGPREELTSVIQDRVQRRASGGPGRTWAAARRRAEDEAVEDAAADRYRAQEPTPGPGRESAEGGSAEGEPGREQ